MSACAWKQPLCSEPSWSLTQNKWNHSGCCSWGQKRTEEETVSSEQTSSLVPGWWGVWSGCNLGRWEGPGWTTCLSRLSDADIEGKETCSGGQPAFPPSPHRMDPTAYAEQLKEFGNQVFKNGNFSLAIRKYDEAIQILRHLYQWG